MKIRFPSLFNFVLIMAVLSAGVFHPQYPAYALDPITIQPVTWNVIGLDSNNVNVGPNRFPVGARVCNNTGSTQTVTSTFNWDDGLDKFTGNTYINLRSGTSDVVSTSIATGTCTDAYFEVEVARRSDAYNKTRRYSITAFASPSSSTATTTIPRELFVEHLVSQSRNAVSDMLLAPNVAGSPDVPGTFVSIGPGGTMALVKGNTYWIKLVGSTATNGYEQIESFINMPNTIFRVEAVNTTYVAGTSPNDKLYGDACTWVNDPNSPNYRSCASTGKQGGDITVTYKVTVLSVPSAPLANPEPIGTLIYDFSGSSYHYNGDYGVSSRIVAVTDPAQANISKSFSPSVISLGGTSRLTININNMNPAAVSGYNFTDPLPSNMKVAATPNASTSSCGTPTFSPAMNDTTLTFSGGTVAANGTCTIQVDVTTTTTGNPFTNDTNELYVDSLNTNKTASADLTVTTAAASPTPTCNQELATWDFSSSHNPTWQSPLVSSAVASSYGTLISTDNATVNGRTGVWSVASNSTGDKWFEKPTPLGCTVGSTCTTYPDRGASPYIEFSVDSSKFTNVKLVFDIDVEGNWAASSNNHIYVWSNSNGGTFDAAPRLNFSPVNNTTWYPGNVATASTTGSSTTAFRINEEGGKETGTLPSLNLDNVKIVGCEVLNPPTITKSFSPSPVAVGTNSTLTFTITNPNVGPTATLTGIDVSDYLPMTTLQGTVDVNSSSYIVTGHGTAFLSQLVSNSVVTIPSTPVNLTGTIDVTNDSYFVTGNATLFTTELAQGSTIFINSVKYTVSDIVSNTSLILANQYVGATDTTHTLTVSRYKKYTVASIQSDTSLTLSSYPAATQTGVNMTAGLTLTASPATTCRGTASGYSGGSAISLSGDRLQGYISSVSGTAITGTNTAFNTQLSVGSRLQINSIFYEVTAITDATHMTLNASPGTAPLLYFYYTTPIQGTVTVTSGSSTLTGNGTAFLSQLVANDIIYIKTVRYTVSSIASNTSLTLTSSYSGLTESNLNINANYVLEGTVTTTSGSATVTGSGTLFKTELRAGNVIYINTTPYIVSSIASNTSLTLTTTVGTGASNQKVSRESPLGLAGGGSNTCSITATVKASTTGVQANVSDNISSNEGGTNTGPSGYASANLNAILPPVIDKQFSPNPIQTNGVSTLTFTITNPNQNDTLSGLAFSDTFPATPGTGMKVASTPNASSTCGGTFTFTPSASATSVTFPTSGTATLAGGASCVVKVNITAPNATGNLTGTLNFTNGSSAVTGSTSPASTAFSSELAAGRTIYVNSVPYTIALITDNTHLTLTTNYAGATESGLTVPAGYYNISGTVSHVINSVPYTGNAASDMLMVNNVNPRISILKQVSTSASGPWYNNLAISPGGNVYYKFTVENIGDVAFTAFNVTDPDSLVAAAFGNPINPTNCNGVLHAWMINTTTLPVGTSSVDPSAVCVIGPVSAASSGSHPNTATVHGTYSSTDYTASDAGNYDITSLSIVKSATESYYTTAGTVLHYGYLVTNNGSAKLMGPVTVSDDKTTNETCSAVSTVGDNDDWLDPGENITCSSTYTVAAGDVGTGNSVVNTATASGYADELRTVTVTSPSDSETVSYKAFDLTITNTNNALGGSNLVALGESFTWTLTANAIGDSGTDATFTAGQTILSEPLPSATYGSVTPGNFTLVTNSGNILCSISTGTLTCSASGGPVTIDAGGSFTASFTVTPTGLGALSATATIDPNTLISEANESNNTDSDTVTVQSLYSHLPRSQARSITILMEMVTMLAIADSPM